MRPGLSLGLGLRYDWQNYFHDNNNVAPRFSVAYAPGNNKTNVLRAGVGVFNDRSGPVVIADVLHSQPGGLIKYVITDPGYPDPFASAAAAAATPPSIVRLAPDVQIPQTLQYSVGLDHQLQKTLTLSLTYTGARGYHLFRSRDVNAPPPPLYLTRPDPAYGAIREVESNGRQETDSLQVTLRGKVTTLVQRPDAVHAEPRLQRHQRHRIVPGQRLRPVRRMGARRLRPASPHQPARENDRRSSCSISASASRRTPADRTTKRSASICYNNGRGRARPDGVPRNSLDDHRLRPARHPRVARHQARRRQGRARSHARLRRLQRH